MAYTKLDKSQLLELYKNLKGYFENTFACPGMIKVVNKYFPNAHSILVEVESEYNDETYDNTAKSIYVYDENDIEIGLSKEDRKNFNDEIANHLDSLVPDCTEDYLEHPIVIYVNKQLPEIYIKEK